MFPGHVAELIARCNEIPDGCWELCEREGYRVIEVTGWFIAAATARNIQGRNRQQGSSLQLIDD